MFQFSRSFACLSNCIPKITRAAVCFSQLLSVHFLWAFETQIFVNNPRNGWSMDPRLTWNLSHCSVALRFVFLTQQQWLNCVDVFVSTCTASVAAWTPVDCSELHKQPVFDSVLRPTFVQTLSYKLSSVVTFTFIYRFLIKILSPLLNTNTKQRQSSSSNIRYT